MRPGHVIDGRYEVIGLLGRGGFGVVQQARDVETGRLVAIKSVLRSEMSERQRERFRREGELTARLDHPGIVRVHSSGFDRGRPYLVYELIEDCRPLDQVEGTLSDRVRLVRDAALALGYAHAQGIVHRDVKAENLLVDASGRVRVSDFGVARAVGLEALTRTGALVGTPSCMAPEQMRGGRNEVTPALDVWALGVLLYEVLAGEVPFPASSLVEMIVMIGSTDPPRPTAVNDRVSPALEAVCIRALSKAPERRYADGAAMAEALDAALAATGRDRPGAVAVAGIALAVLLIAVGAALALGDEAGGGHVTRESAGGGAGGGSTETGSGVEQPELETAEAGLERLSKLKGLALLRGAQEWQSAHPGQALSGGVRARVRRVRATRLAELRAPGVWKLAFLDGDRAAVASQKELVIWDLQARAVLMRYRSHGTLKALAVSPDESRFAVSGGGAAVTLLGASGGDVTTSPLLGASAVLSLAFSPAGDRLAIGRKRRAGVFAMPKLERLFALPGMGDTQTVAFSPDGRRLVTVGRGFGEKGLFVGLWDVEGAAPKLELRENLSSHEVVLVFDPMGRFLFVGDNNGRIVRYDLRAGSAYRRTEFVDDQATPLSVAHTGRVKGLAVGPAGEVLYSITGNSSGARSGGEFQLSVWDAHTAAILTRKLQGSEPYSSLSLSADGAFLLVGNAGGGVVELWPTAVLREEAEARGE